MLWRGRWSRVGGLGRGGGSDLGSRPPRGLVGSQGGPAAPLGSQRKLKLHLLQLRPELGDLRRLPPLLLEQLPLEQLPFLLQASFSLLLQLLLQLLQLHLLLHLLLRKQERLTPIRAHHRR